MRQEQFNEIINRLDTDPVFGISVYNLTKGVRAIELNKNKDEIISKYGSLENFFNGLFQNGVTKICIQPKRRNGQNGRAVSWINHPKFESQEFNLKSDEQPIPQPLQQPFTASAPVQYTQSSLGVPGLGIPEYVSLKVSEAEKNRLANENQILKIENESLKKENLQYKKNELENEYKTGKSDKTHELILGLVQNADKLKGIFSGGGGAVAPVPELGLGNPGNLTPQQQALINVIAQADDFTINLVTHLYNAVATETPLTADVTEVLKKHNIVE